MRIARQRNATLHSRQRNNKGHQEAAGETGREREAVMRQGKWEVMASATQNRGQRVQHSSNK